jgi:transcription elongation factor Elf1
MKNTSGYLISNRKKKGLRENPNISRARLQKKRLCLKCGKKFSSKGHYNRICERCGLLNERMAISTYSVGDTTSNKPDILEARLYELN